MIRCENCGAPAQEQDKFCKNCGCPVCASVTEQVVPPGVSQSPIPETQKNPTGTVYPPVTGYGSQKKSDKGMVAVVLTLLLVIIIVAATISVVVLRRSAAPPVFGGGSGGGGYVGPQTQGVVPATPSAEPVVSKKEKVEGKIEKFLQDNGIANDVSVAVYNNLTQEQYSSSNGNRIYTAWGLYLPVYLAYGKNSNIDWGAYESIMSSDPGVCNENANYAIRSMGGFQAVNDRLKNYYGATGTTYGRFFGDTGASTDNYTTANDSVRFLSELDKMDKHGLLSYNLGSFGISAPGGASVNAHIGTENRSERKQLNIFAIVKGNSSDYCVSILTENYNGGYITSLLSTIHTEMEM